MSQGDNFLSRFKASTEIPIKQEELSILRTPEKDRNHKKGGRSFYFFDFDDNVATLSTITFLYHKRSKKRLGVSSKEFAENSHLIGKGGSLKDYEIDFAERGSFRNFRDIELSLIKKILGRKQSFVKDMKKAIGEAEFEWKGPSWNCFYHAVFNRRPISIITARGHNPETIKDGISLLVKEGFLPHEPNYLSIYPVNHPETVEALGFKVGEKSVPELKKVALQRSVEKAFEVYGKNKSHRFGMSDDDPKNIELIEDEMRALKVRHPENGFFIIDTSAGRFIKREIYSSYSSESCLLDNQIETDPQISLF